MPNRIVNVITSEPEIPLDFPGEEMPGVFVTPFAPLCLKELSRQHPEARITLVTTDTHNGDGWTVEYRAGEIVSEKWEDRRVYQEGETA